MSPLSYASRLRVRGNIRSAYRNAILADRPSAYWRLGEPSTSSLPALNDELGLFSGIYTNQPVFGVTGPLARDANTGVVFNGTSQYASVAYTPTLNQRQFSFEIWVNLAGGSGNYRGVCASKFGNTGWILYVDANENWSFWLGTGSTVVAITGDHAPLRTWTHVAGTYDGITARLYVNGIAVASAATAFSQNTTNPFTIGQGETGAGFFFPGSLAEVSLFPGALSAAQVARHYLVGITGPTSSLMASTRTMAISRQPVSFPFASGTTAAGPLQPGVDAKTRQIIAQAQRFFTWLNGQNGFIGEIGIPGNSNTSGGRPEFGRWSALAEIFYRFADWVEWPVTYWAAGPQNYLDGIGVYTQADGLVGPGITTALPPSQVVERHLTPPDRSYLRGVNLSGPEFGRSDMGTVLNNSIMFSAANTGANTSDYFWPTQADYNFIASRGVRTIRLNLTPERMYPTLYSTLSGLDSTQASNLQSSLTFANNAGVQVMPVYQGHGQYLTGTTSPGSGTQVWHTLTQAKLNEIWRATIATIQSMPAFYGIGLVSEPVSNHAFNLGIAGQITAAINPGDTVTSISVNGSQPAIPPNTQLWVFLGNPLGFTSVESFTVTSAGASGGATSIPVVSKIATTPHAIGDNISALKVGCTSDGIVLSREAYQDMAQNCVTYLRGGPLGYLGRINVELWYWSSLSNCFVSHPGGPFVSDPANNVSYEAHFYWDSGTTDTLGGSGTYTTSYATELANAVSLGY